MAGIKDIAKRAGVSISTVSYALNGSPKVTEKTRARIFEIAKELNYIPNMAGRNLRKKDTKIIGVYLATYGGTFYGDLLEGIMNTVNAEKYEMIVCSGDRSRLFLPERMIDGAIILDTAYPDEEILSYAERGHKMVVLDRKLEHENIRQVLLDNKAGAKKAVQSLMKNNSRMIYLITGPEDSFDTGERLKAAAEELDYNKRSYKLIAGDFTEQSGRKAAARLHNEWTEPVSVFAMNDEMAIGVYNYMKETDLTIGKDLFIVGFDNLLLSKYMVPRLASISYSKHRWGSAAAETLLSLIADGQAEHKILKTELTFGESLGEQKVIEKM